MGNICAPVNPLTVQELLAQKTWTHKTFGTIDDIHSKVTNLNPIPYTGLCVEVTKRLADHLRHSHMVHLFDNRSDWPVFRFGSGYFREHPSDKSMLYPAILCEIGTYGRVDTTFVHMFSEHIRGKCAVVVQNSMYTSSQLGIDYSATNTSASMKILTANSYEGSFHVVGELFKAVTSNIDIGAKIDYMFGPWVSTGQLSEITVGGRYTNGGTVWAGSLSQRDVHFSYYNQIEQPLQIGIEFQTDLEKSEGIIRLGYQIDIAKVDAAVRVSFDSTGNVCFLLEKRFKEFPLLLKLIFGHNRQKTDFRFGCGIMIT